jgi:tryptophan 2,3-dioxygenase
MTQPPLYYADYLQLDRLLSLQFPESAKHGPSVNDEMLFIIIHQAYELWFKQALHEFDRVEWDFSANPVDDEAMARIVHSLARVHEILKLLVTQLDVLETMTPADFIDFRDYLLPAFGFQALQPRGFRQFHLRLQRVYRQRDRKMGQGDPGSQHQTPVRLTRDIP